MKLKPRAKEKIMEALRGFFLLVPREYKKFRLSKEVQLVFPIPSREITKWVPTYDSDKDITKIIFYEGNVPLEQWTITYDGDKDITEVVKA